VEERLLIESRKQRGRAGKGPKIPIKDTYPQQRPTSSNWIPLLTAYSAMNSSMGMGQSIGEVSTLMIESRLKYAPLNIAAPGNKSSMHGFWGEISYPNHSKCYRDAKHLGKVL
jgi:hypothetical protein